MGGEACGQMRAVGALRDVEGALVKGGDVMGEGQAETGAAAVFGAGVVEAGEAFEDAGMVLQRDAGAVIVDLEYGLLPVGVMGEADGDGAGGVALGVVEEVAQYSCEQHSVTMHKDGSVCGGIAEVQVHSKIGWRVTASHLFADEACEVDVFAGGGAHVVGVGVQAGQEEQVGGEVLQSEGVAECVADRARPVGGGRLGEGEFELGAECGQRGAQLMRGVSDKAFLLLDRRIQAVQGTFRRPRGRHRALGPVDRRPSAISI